MHQGAREEITRIRVDSSGTWFTGNRKIVNEEVLQFFRDNLHRDEKGIYIYNEFRGFREKGYIDVAGPLLTVEEIRGDVLVLSNGEAIPVATAEVAMDGASFPYVKIPRLGAWASFPARITHAFAEGLHEQNGDFYWRGRKVTVYQAMPWVTV